jgi:hypothetical protein
MLNGKIRFGYGEREREREGRGKDTVPPAHTGVLLWFSK